VGAGVVGDPLVSEGVPGEDGALGDEGDTVVVLRTSLVDTVPMDGQLHTFNLIVEVDDNLVAFANLDAGTWDHSVDGEDTSLNTVG
jgi:hypothetical protein